MEFHKISSIFPINEKTIEDLADDIKKNGLTTPIVLYEGKILDGRRRWIACLQAGVEPTTVIADTTDPIALLWSLNSQSRNMTPSQRAMCAGRAIKLMAKDEGTKESSRVIGDVFGISGNTAEYGLLVVERGTIDLQKAVDEDRLSVSTAAKMVHEPAEVQDQKAARYKRAHKTKPYNVRDIPEGESHGEGVRRANEAINCLMKIPKRDPLRTRAFEMVAKFIRQNKS